jgi:type IV secretory pathway VirB2 component (pilin)
MWMTWRMERKLKLFTVGTLALSMAQRAHANTSTIAALETPLQSLQTSLSGPIALSIGIIAVVITGAMLIFGGEISDFGKRMAYVVLVLGILLSANTIITSLFTNTSALIF